MVSLGIQALLLADGQIHVAAAVHQVLHLAGWMRRMVRGNSFLRVEMKSGVVAVA
jgi:hypothetical protein